MFTGNIESVNKNRYFADRFEKAFRWIKDTDLKSLPVGTYEIDGKNVYASVQEYTTMPEAECKFETHEKYFDIQYLAEGEEFFGMEPVSELTPTTDYDAKSDIRFYKTPAVYGGVHLREGDFAVVPPEDAHMPRRIGEKACKVKKAVIKVLVDKETVNA